MIIFFNREHIRYHGHGFWEEKKEKECGGEGESRKHKKIFKINVKDVGGRLSPLRRLMIKLV